MKSLKFKAGTLMPSRKSLFSLQILYFHCIFLAGYMFIGSTLWAQQVNSVDVSQMGGGFNSLGNFGDTLKFQFRLGTEAQPVQNAVGYSIQFNFPELASPPTHIGVMVDGTWLAVDDPAIEPDWAFDPTTHSLSLDYLRSDGVPKSGNGVVAHIYLIREGGFSNSENVIELDGGVVMVENMDLRIGSPQLTNRIYPNPTEGWIRVEVDEPDDCELQIWDIYGQILFTQPCNYHQDIDLSYFPRGCYWLALKSANGQWVRKVERH